MESHKNNSEDDAPNNFFCDNSQITSLSSLNLSNLSYKRKCPICKINCKKFICKICIKKGDIVHSTQASYNPERLSDKQEKYRNLQIKLHKCYMQYNEFLIKPHKTENLSFELKRKREKIGLLNHLIKETRESIQEKKKFNDKLKQSNKIRENILPKYEDKVRKLEDFVSDRLQQIEKLKDDKLCLIKDVKEITCNEVQKLISYIFPIEEIILKDETSSRGSSLPDSSGSSTLSTLDTESLATLSEAKNTSYIRGKWVFHGSGISEMQYRIVGPSLPANGDYGAYSNWLFDKDDSKTNEIIPSRAASYRIIGALTYTTQLTNLLSYYLNVRLPYKLGYGDFSRKLTEQQFSRRVSRLNSNIVYLAYTQRVRLSALNENHTLENILAILNTDNSDLGRMGPNDVNDAPLMNSIDSILLIDTGTESESEDENSLRLDWEAVPQQQEILHPLTVIPNQQTQSIMTSAANSIASIFRGWTK